MYCAAASFHLRLATRSTNLLDDITSHASEFAKSRRESKAGLRPLRIHQLAGWRSKLRHQQGAAMPADAEDAAGLTALLTDFSEPEVSRLLLLYLAGPYRSDDGWVLRLPSRASLDGTRQELLDAADGNGLVTHADVTISSTKLTYGSSGMANGYPDCIACGVSATTICAGTVRHWTVWSDYFACAESPRQRKN